MRVGGVVRTQEIDRAAPLETPRTSRGALPPAGVANQAKARRSNASIGRLRGREDRGRRP